MDDFKVSNPTFPGSRTIAIKSFERAKYGKTVHMAKQPQLREAYDKFMRDYLDLHHMEPVPKAELERGNV